MFKTIYLTTEQNSKIKELAAEAGLSDSKFIVTKCLDKTTFSDLLFKPRKSD